MIDIIQALEDKHLLGQFLEDPMTWASWFTFLRAFFALPGNDTDLELYQRCTGRTEWPESESKEAWLSIGTRGGKSRTIALLATYLAVFREYNLSVGEKGYIIIVSVRKKQAQIIASYLSSFFLENPFLKPYLAKDPNSEGVELINNIVIAPMASDYRSLRGFTAVAAIIDECAYLASEGARPDEEIVRALRSRLTSTGGPLFSISSPYAKKGELWKTRTRHYGKDGSKILYWEASSQVMNPTLDEESIQQAYEEDPIGAACDYGGQFRSDISDYISRESIESVVAWGCYEVAYSSEHYYKSFVDMSGAGNDSMVLCIGHTEEDIRVLDVIREIIPPCNTDAVCKEFSELLKSYHLFEVTGDAYAGLWPSDRFAAHGITYNKSALPASDLYIEFLPLANSKRARLLEHKKMIDQFVNLERRTGRGKDAIHHPQGHNNHDDISNATAGCLVNLGKCIVLEYASTGILRDSEAVIESSYFDGTESSNMRNW